MKTISQSESRRTKTLMMSFLFFVLVGGTQTARAQWSGTTNIYYNGGNVGIGTTSPQATLHVYGSSSNVDLLIGNGISGEARLRLSYDFTSGYGKSVINSYRGASGYTPLEMDASSVAFNAHSGGYVGIGKPNPTVALDVVGSVNLTGTINAKYQDVAEWVSSSEKLSAGTVVVLDSTKSNQVTSSTISYDTRVAGVVSEQPGLALGEKSEGKVLVATTGRVRVKVDATKAPIHIGDLLVTSDIPGVAMKSEPVNLGGVQIHRPGTLIGKAQEPLEKGSGSILVLLSLQ